MQGKVSRMIGGGWAWQGDQCSAGVRDRIRVSVVACMHDRSVLYHSARRFVRGKGKVW